MVMDVWYQSGLGAFDTRFVLGFVVCTENFDAFSKTLRVVANTGNLSSLKNFVYETV